MSNYKIGIGGYIATPDQIKEEANRLHAEIMAVGNEIHDKIYVPSSWTLQAGVTVESPIYKFYTNIWTPWKNEWLKFHEDRQMWSQNLWGTTWDQIQEYRKKLIQLHESAKAIGVPFIGPKPQEPPPKDPILPSLPKLSGKVYLGVGLLGALLIWRLTK